MNKEKSMLVIELGTVSTITYGGSGHLTENTLTEVKPKWGDYYKN